MEDTAYNSQSSREARILARRKRIQERLAALREGDNGGMHIDKRHTIPEAQCDLTLRT